MIAKDIPLFKKTLLRKSLRERGSYFWGTTMHVLLSMSTTKRGFFQLDKPTKTSGNQKLLV